VRRIAKYRSAMMAQETIEKNKRRTRTPLETYPDREMIFIIDESHPSTCKSKVVSKNRKKDPPVF
jgi:hypothetical protein